jgi:hypothetical protein
MKNRFDRVAKDALAEALAPMADVSTGVETSPDAQSIDVWSVPTAEPLADLGWLGQMAREPCLIEPYSGTVRLDEVRDCLRKQLGRYHELQNKEAARWKNVPALWILSTGRPQGALELGFEPASDWPRGFYRLAGLRVCLVVRNELPRDRATLILRATGTGRVLKEAIEDLWQEPEDSRIRAILMIHLVGLHLDLFSHPSGRTPEEEEFVMTGAEMLRELEAKAHEAGRKEGAEMLRELEAKAHEAGRKEGEKKLRELEAKAHEAGREGARRMVRLAFEQRFGPIPSFLAEALGRIQDMGELEQVMAACLSKPKDEIARILGVGVH